MANYDKSLERMHYLMNYDNSLNESAKKTNSGIEYHTTAADGKEYGIIKEGRRFYIKTTTPDKKELAESYDYINGYNYRNENGFNSYNEATKQLELRLMSINESFGKHEDVSVANLNKTKEALAILTEDARKELDRMHAIFENSFISKENIGDHGDQESKGKAIHPADQSEPYTKEVKPDMEFDGEKGSVENAMEHNKPADPNNKLQHADKMEKGPKGDEGYKKTTPDQEGGKGYIAATEKNGAKAVKMNEGMFEGDMLEDDEVDLSALGAEEYNKTPEFNPDDFHADDIDAKADSMDALGDEDPDSDIFGDADPGEPLEGDQGPEGLGDPYGSDEDGLVGLDGEMDKLLEEFLGEECEGKESILKGDPCTLAGDAGKGENDVHGEETMDKTPLQEDEENHEAEGAGEKESKITGPDAVMDSEEGAGSGDNNVHGEKTMDRLQETINRIAQAVCEGLKAKKTVKESTKKKETLQEAIDRIVAEEVTKLDAWGKHPRYQKPAFRTPANKEVLAGTAEDDWNDESARGEQPYGKKIGNGKPFDKTVEMLTDQVLANLKESLRLGK